jgi:hypothetical protein
MFLAKALASTSALAWAYTPQHTLYAEEYTNILVTIYLLFLSQLGSGDSITVVNTAERIGVLSVCANIVVRYVSNTILLVR